MWIRTVHTPVPLMTCVLHHRHLHLHLHRVNRLPLPLLRTRPASPPPMVRSLITILWLRRRLLTPASSVQPPLLQLVNLLQAALLPLLPPFKGLHLSLRLLTLALSALPPQLLLPPLPLLPPLLQVVQLAQLLFTHRELSHLHPTHALSVPHPLSPSPQPPLL